MPSVEAQRDARHRNLRVKKGWDVPGKYGGGENEGDNAKNKYLKKYIFLE